jgi:hypothetical protein
MDYAEFRRRMLKSVASWPRERRERFVADLLPEILRQPGRYRRLTGEEIFREGRPETDRLARFPLLLDGDDPRTAILGRSGAIDLASQMSGESRFAFRMPDDSMAPRYAKGTILVADSDRQTDDGRPAIVGLADLPTTCRIVRREGSEVRFTPLNGQFRSRCTRWRIFDGHTRSCARSGNEKRPRMRASGPCGVAALRQAASVESRRSIS